MKKFIVATRGLAYVIDCSTEQQVKYQIRRLKKLGYKKPLVYLKLQNRFSETD